MPSRGSSQLLSALGRRHLAADLAAWVGLGVNIDIPLARRHLLRLFGRERGLTFDGVANGGALFAQPDHRRGIFALRRRPVEMRHGGRAGETAMVHIPCQHPRGGVVSQISRAGGAGLHRRHLLRAVQIHLE